MCPMVSAFCGGARPQPSTTWHSYRINTHKSCNLMAGGNQHNARPQVQDTSSRPAPYNGEGKTQQKPSPNKKAAQKG
jgi:hypothetical protein